MNLCAAVLSIVAYICLPLADASPIGWDYAVTLRSKILFLDNKWNTIVSAAHEYDKLSGLAFDEAEEVLYFNDQQHTTGSIFSLRRDAMAATHIVEQAVQRTGNDSVAGLAYDPLNRNLFWVDTHQSKIFFASIDTLATEPPKVLVDLSAEDERPDSVAVDICRRQLYWSSSKRNQGSVERISLNGTGRQTIFDKNMDMPRGIVVDQLTDRIFWIDMSGIFFTVESANLDGSDRQLVLKDKFHDPIQLAVTEDTIFWTDRANKAVWSFPKPKFNFNNSSYNATEMQPEPTIQKVANWTEDVHGIVARTGFYQRLQKDAHCASVVKKVKQRLDNETNRNTPPLSLTDKRVEQLEREHCLNGASFKGRGNFCVCQLGYKGARCEISECHNFCVHGTCVINNAGFPQCYCQPDYYGERCGYNKCSDHCLNGGHCKVDHDSGNLSCECTEHFTGTRCEQNTTVSCSIYCLQLKQQADTIVPDSCIDICDELLSNNVTSIAEYRQARICSTPSVFSGSVIIVLVAGIVASLCLVALIVHGLRLIYKPKRPHIKKTFVVRKQARHNSSSDTPLTNRPLATEQCEITIENCCNMNICETPCFDPKLVEQTFSARDKKAPRIKEDKKILINSMEDDLLS